MKKSVTIFDPLGHASGYSDSMATTFRDLGYAVDFRRQRNFLHGWRFLSLPVKIIYLYVNLLRVLIGAKRKRHPIIFNFLHFPLLDGTIIRLLGGRHCHLVVHNLVANHNEGSIIYRLGFDFLLRSFDKFVAHTDETAFTIAKVVEKYSTIVRVDLPAALVTNSYSDKPLALGLNNYVLFFGTVRPYKGLDVLIDAIENNSLLNQPTFRLVVAGQFSASSKALKNRLLGLNASVEIFDERIDEVNIQALFNASLGIVMPYRHIDGSGVFAQARAYKKPMIASSIGIFKEQIKHGQNGLLFRVGSSDELAQALEEFWNSKKLRLTLSQNCSKTEISTWPQYVESLEIDFNLQRDYFG